MPLIKSKSKQAFKENIKAEMDSGKPMNQSLAIAYDVKRRSKKPKMADGGLLDKVVKATSDYYNAKDPTPTKKPEQDPRTIKPVGPAEKSSSYAEGGPVMKQKFTKLKYPSMTQSPVFSVKLRNEEDDTEASMPPMKHEGMSEDKGPSKEAYDDKDAAKPRFAKGGMINEEVSMDRAEEDQVVHPEGLEEDDDMKSPAQSEYMADHFAEGGMAHEMDMQPEPEEEEEHHDSLAAAIMAKRRRMAEGGRVDIESNEEEQPNQYYGRNQAVLKEHYGDDLDQIHQPMDSNLMGDDREDESENKLDMVSSIRRKMSSKRMK